jgi:hypothetical protein
VCVSYERTKEKKKQGTFLYAAASERGRNGMWQVQSTHTGEEEERTFKFRFFLIDK